MQTMKQGNSLASVNKKERNQAVKIINPGLMLLNRLMTQLELIYGQMLVRKR